MKKIVPINYTSRDFDSIRQDLINYAKRYYSNTIQDFTDNSFNSFIFDSVAYVGDILSYYLDVQANESYLSTANQVSNILKLGEELGYKNLNNSGASSGLVAIYAAVPAINGAIDYRYAPTLKKGSVFSTSEGKIFTLSEDLELLKGNSFSYTISKRDSFGTPTEYAVKNYGKVISGNLIQKTFTIGNFNKFLKINLEEKNVTEIISVFDSDGNEYYEVDYLSQNVIYKELKNTNSDNNKVSSLMKTYNVPRRFMVQNLQNTTILIFGGGSPEKSADYSLAMTEPSSFVLDIENKNYFSDKYFDPNSMVSTNKLGIGPANTTLVVICRVNNQEDVNVSSGFLNIVKTPILEFKDPTILSENKIDELTNSLEVENEESIVGSIETIDAEELKIRIKNNFAAQNRAVTLKDYESLAYSMPSKFGSIKRVRAVKDNDSQRRNINLYVTSQDDQQNFTSASNTLKNNLKLWISQNKMIMDSIDILDAKIINLKIQYTIMGNNIFPKEEILFNSKQALIDLFSKKSDIGEPLFFSSVTSALLKLKEVTDVIDIKIQQKVGENYSNIYFNIEENISEDERYIIFPNNVLYEVKFPEIDIQGVIV